MRSFNLVLNTYLLPPAIWWNMYLFTVSDIPVLIMGIAYIRRPCVPPRGRSTSERNLGHGNHSCRCAGGDPGVVNQKTPTTLLLNPDGEFHSFGFTARDAYHDLDAQEAKRWMFFEKFKMTLHSNEVCAPASSCLALAQQHGTAMRNSLEELSTGKL